MGVEGGSGRDDDDSRATPSPSTKLKENFFWDSSNGGKGREGVRRKGKEERGGDGIGRLDA